MGASAELIRHDASRAGAARSIRVEASRAAGGALRLRYGVSGEIARLFLPTPRGPERRDGLWQHTCFEAFLRAAGTDAYHEFNFAPSGDWAAYRFTSRRAGRSEPALPAPRIHASRSADRFVLEAELALAGFDGQDLEAGIAAVIEDADGALSFWALAHGAAAPDFHDPAGFTMRLPAR